jgi:hypothetical protein
VIIQNKKYRNVYIANNALKKGLFGPRLVAWAKPAQPVTTMTDPVFLPLFIFLPLAVILSLIFAQNPIISVYPKIKYS